MSEHYSNHHYPHHHYPKSYAVVIPAYNESATIREVAKKALRHAPLVIVVDDGSSDDTAAQLQGLDVEVLRNKTNSGKGGSIWRGLYHAINKGADAVFTLDGDGQHDPNDIPDLLNEARINPHAMIIGARLLNRENAPKARLFANNFADFWVSWAAGQFVQDSQSGFRLYPKSLIENVKVGISRKHSFVFESEIAIEAGRLGHKIICCPIVSQYHDNARPSHFKASSDITKIVLMITWKLVSRGTYAHGLVRSLVQRARYQRLKKASQVNT
jgi:glycosyltransferase involved in cell wall biosynthesis